MTEEIIIDGVNVAECGAYKDKHCKDKTSIIFCDTNLCSNYPYCYYKQLKRLEQENKELGRKAFLVEQSARTTASTFCEKDNKIIELEQENKELKEKIIELSEEKGHLIVENNTLKESNQSLSMLGTDLASANETVRKEFFRADKNKDMWREKAEEYRSALDTIQRMVLSAWEQGKYLDGGLYNDLTNEFAKINEVLNESK
jgi:chromosome segregation ATPase